MGSVERRETIRQVHQSEIGIDRLTQCTVGVYRRYSNAVLESEDCDKIKDRGPAYRSTCIVIAFEEETVLFLRFLIDVEANDSQPVAVNRRSRSQPRVKT